MQACPFNRIIQGDAMEVLHSLPDGCVQMCMTSPPYWGLRDYGVEGQLGMEESPEEYVEKMVAVFREVKRVLRDDGTLWVNMGGSYANYGTGGNGATGGRDKSTLKSQMPPVGTTPVKKNGPPGLKPKDLVGIPWRLAFALQADGWFLRSDIIWAKPNPMPESVTDRPTKAHEYLFLLSKSKKYYYDAEAIKETATDTGRENGRDGRIEDERARPPGSNPRTLARVDFTSSGRNCRDVWTIPTQPFPGSHFATYPEELCRRPILAGTSERGCCPKCGAPWERMVERISDGKSYAVGKTAEKRKAGLATGSSGYDDGSSCPQFKTIGWRPTCSCGIEETVPCVVLDPFAGSGTTLLVANNHARRWVGIELNPEYVKLANKRLRQKCIWEK